MIAHELRSPLAVMSNVLKVYRASIAAKALPGAGDMLDRQVNKALRLVNDLMDLSRVSEDQLRLERVPVDLGRVILDVSEDLDQDFRRRQQVLVLELSAQAVWVRGDACRLEQIVENLLENSGKYSPEGAMIAVALSREGGQAVLRVRDNGTGIPSDDLPHIFEPYFRGSSPGQRSRGGLGLGLTLTRRLVQLHDGTIEATSRGAGCGSEFTVRLSTTPGPGA
ncbi:MAG TPA: HAMP domain-containing sensor histidine kinase [Steroidobacteraceae bacterium]|nr:HAMP domain-containing sensor histidine kinase [Steroidobacteraceae bacterium]